MVLKDTVLDKYVPGSTTAFRVQTKTYGTNSQYNFVNRLLYSFHSGGRIQYSYNHLGNILYDRYIPFANYQEEVNVLNVSLSSETIASLNTYDALSRPITKTRQDNSKDTYTYNTAGLLKSVSMRTRASGAYKVYISDIKYNEKGQRTEVYYGNNSKTRYEYDPYNFRLTRLLTTRGSGNEVVQDINYTYDAVGNIVEILDNAQKTLYFSNMEIEAKQQFEYDALYRLLKATGREKDQLGMPTEADIEAYPVSSKGQASNYTQNFTYDKLGNILKIQHTAAQSPNSWTRDYVYESINNRLLKHDSNQANAVYTYDAHGNMLTMPHLPTMEWDSVDHLHKSVRGNDTTWYKYDVDGNRRRKITDKPGGIKEERIYHGDYEVYRKYVNDVLQEETRTVHVSDGERRIATVDYKTVENGVAITSFTDVVRYQYDNHLGSACLELDNNANVITYEEYHPFGTSSYKLADNETEVKRKRYRYVGKERDEETGLYYYGARYYAAWIARFVSVDPMANQRTWVSPYNYCQNNPINRIDPNGALDEDPPKGANPELYQEDKDVLNSNNGSKLSGNPYESSSNSVSMKKNLTVNNGGLKVYGKEDQELALKIITKAFGNQGKNFSFIDNTLIFTGDKSSFDKTEKEVFEGLKKVMDSNTITEIIFSKNSYTDSHGGEATFTITDFPNYKNNTIYVDPIEIYKRLDSIHQTTMYQSKSGGVTPSENMAKTDNFGSSIKAEKRISYVYTEDSIASRFFHAIGHVLYQKSNEQENVIHYDNKARSIFKKLNSNGGFKKAKEPMRVIDERHKNK